MSLTVTNICFICRAKAGSIPSKSQNKFNATLKIFGNRNGKMVNSEKKVIAIAENSLSTEEKKQYATIEIKFDFPHYPPYQVCIEKSEVLALRNLLLEKTLINEIWPNLSQESSTFNKAEEELLNSLENYEELLNTPKNIQIQAL